MRGAMSGASSWSAGSWSGGGGSGGGGGGWLSSPVPDNYMDAWRQGFQAGFLAAVIADDKSESETEVVTPPTKKRKGGKKKKCNKVEYTEPDMKASPLFFWKSGKGEDHREPYPEEIQVKLRVAYARKIAGEDIADIRYSMTDARTFRLRIIGADEAGAWKEALTKYEVKTFVGAQWDWDKECDPPTDIGRGVTFRPIMARVDDALPPVKAEG